jgi:hypothetical protein
MDKPPLPLMRLATCCRAPLALATLFSKCLLKDSFGSSQKSSYLVGALPDHKCMFGDLEALDSPCTRTVSARVPRCIQSEAFWDYTANLTRICSRFRSQGLQCIAKRFIHFHSNRCTGTRMVLPDLDRSCFAPAKALVGCSVTIVSTGPCCLFGPPFGLLF